MKTNFLISVWKESKMIFFVFLLFIASQFFFMNKRIQNFPFFIFDMYSRPLTKPKVFSLYEIKKDGKAFDYTQLKNNKESILLQAIQNYEINQQVYPDYMHQDVLNKRFKLKLNAKQFSFIEKGLSNDSTTIQKFPAWINNYLQVSHSLNIKKNTYRYSDKKIIASKTIIEHFDQN